MFNNKITCTPGFVIEEGIKVVGRREKVVQILKINNKSVGFDKRKGWIFITKKGTWLL